MQLKSPLCLLVLSSETLTLLTSSKDFLKYQGNLNHFWSISKNCWRRENWTNWKLLSFADHYWHKVRLIWSRPGQLAVSSRVVFNLETWFPVSTRLWLWRYSQRARLMQRLLLFSMSKDDYNRHLIMQLSITSRLITQNKFEAWLMLILKELLLSPKSCTNVTKAWMCIKLLTCSSNVTEFKSLLLFYSTVCVKTSPKMLITRLRCFKLILW